MIWVLLQAAQPAPAPDIELELRLQAREVRTEVDGKARLSVRADPDGGSVDETVRTPNGTGAVQRNVRVTTRAEARIADPNGAAASPAAPARDGAAPPATPEPDRR